MIRPTLLASGAAALAVAALHSHGAQIAFSAATVTYDQGAPYNIAASIDGSVTNGVGWGVFGGLNVAQTAYFQASAAFSASEIGIALPQFLGTNHFAKDFRISYTTDASPGAGSSWTAISPAVYRAANGGGLSLGADNHVLLSANPVSDSTNFFVTASGAFSNVTGFRLELFPVAGTLGAAANGNLVITEFQVATDLSINRATAAAVTASNAPWFSSTGFLTDGNPNSLNHPNTGAQGGFAWTVDLGNVYNLSSLELLNRTDGCCPERLSNYRVEVLNDAQSSVWTGNIRTDGSNSGPGGIDTVTQGMGAGTFSGRYLRITNLSNGDYNPQIAEVRAFGSLAPVPEPAAAALLAAGIGAGLRRRRIG